VNIQLFHSICQWEFVNSPVASAVPSLNVLISTEWH